jgi:hypothetical protein
MLNWAKVKKKTQLSSNKQNMVYILVTADSLRGHEHDEICLWKRDGYPEISRRDLRDHLMDILRYIYIYV